MQMSFLLTSALATITAAQTYSWRCPGGGSAVVLNGPSNEYGSCCFINRNYDRYGGDIEGQRFRVRNSLECYNKCAQYKGPAGSIIEKCASAVWVRNDGGDNCFLKYYRESLVQNTAIDTADCEPCKWKYTETSSGRRYDCYVK